jgi:hypothetical protein
MVVSTGTDILALEQMVEEIKSQAPEELVAMGVRWILKADRCEDKMI